MTRVRAGALAACLVLGACGGSSGGDHEGHGEDTAPAFEAGAATTTVDVTMKDFTFAGLPPTVTGPNVLFDAEVSGANSHELAIHDAKGHVAGLAPFNAGKTRQLAAVLAPGTYTVQCLVKLGDKTHAELGMKAELAVG